ncbi:mucin-binding protein, partial [Paucilactobacillus suebicus]
ATIDYSNLDANGQPTITYGDWTLESENFSAVPAAQVSGMVPDRTSVIADNEAPTVASQASDGSALPADITETVVYHSSTVTVAPSDPKTTTDSIDPNDPNSIKYPAGVDEANLNAQVTRTIDFVDEAGNTVAPAETQTNDYSRTATIDY